MIHVLHEGNGFDVTTALDCTEQMSSFGLFSIQERLGLLGGRLEIESKLGAGTHVRVYAPAGLERAGSEDEE